MIWIIVIICYVIIAAIVGGIAYDRWGDEEKIEAIICGLVWFIFIPLDLFYKLFTFTAKCCYKIRNRKRK